MGQDGYAGGFYTALIWGVTVGGYAIGNQTSLTNGSTAQAILLRDVKTAGLAYNEPANLDIQGGDKIVAQMQFGNAKLNPFDLVISNISTDLITFLASTVLYNTNTPWYAFSTNPNLANPFTIGLGLIQRFQNKAVGTDGPDQFHTLMIPRATARIHLGAFGFQAGMDITIRVTPTMTDKTPQGQAIGTGGWALGVEEDKADHYDLITQNPIHLTTFRSNGSGSTFNTAYKPVDTVITLNATKNWFARNGTDAALTSIVVNTGLATMASAGTAGDYNVLMYQTPSGYNLVS